MYDVIIIGSGPAGLSAAIYAQRAMLKALVIEKEFLGTGQIAESSRVDNYPGLYGESGYDLGEKFRSHAEASGAEFIEAEVTEIIPESGNYVLKLSDGKLLETKTVIYAAGTYRRRLNIKGEQEFSARGISYCAVCDGAFYAGKSVAVIGGGDTALSDALYLSEMCERVYIIHRRDSFRGSEALQERVKKTPNIELVLNAVPTEFFGDKLLSGVKYIQSGEEKTLNVSGSFTAIGSVPNTELLKGIAELDNIGYIIAGEDGITSAGGIFAAGDVRTKKLRQVVTAASDGANCVESVRNYLQSRSG
ncbi:MAG: FAD-dependent oxidoreductase [Oscillospiraceae bacterium]|nr:FAD-dependent oxidoreductase [Oscillospiraceae bacterium]